MNLSDLEKKAREIRLLSLGAIQKSGLPVAGSSMTAVEILVSLYYGVLGVSPVMRFFPQRTRGSGQDYAVLSKIEATAVLYAILADIGCFDREELGFFGQINSFMQGTPSMKVPGVPVSVFSHGQGISAAMGLALSIKAERGANRVFCIADSSEFQIGQVWEAFLAAVHYKLSNLIMFVDDCGLQAEGNMRAIMDVGFIQSKLDSFGWQVYRVTDGHDFDQILNAILKAFNAVRRPVCIWCQTVPGKGIDFAERKQGYFHAPFSESELNEMVSKLMKINE